MKRLGLPSIPLMRNLCITRVNTMIKASANGAAGEIMPVGSVNMSVMVIPANAIERIKRYLVNRFVI